jgi:hypothetical protein
VQRAWQQLWTRTAAWGAQLQTALLVLQVAAWLGVRGGAEGGAWGGTCAPLAPPPSAVLC